MSYNELEQGYLGLTSQPLFYIGDDCGYINWNKIEKSTQAGHVLPHGPIGVM